VSVVGRRIGKPSDVPAGADEERAHRSTKASVTAAAWTSAPQSAKPFAVRRGFIGATLSGKLTKVLGEGPLIIYSALAFQLAGLMWPLSWLFWPEPVQLVGTAALGVSVVVYNVATVSFRQRLCPPRLLGRMNASARFLVWGTIPLGAFLGGILGTTIGVVPTLWVGTAVGFLCMLPVVFSPLWGMQTLPAEYETDTDARPPTPAESAQPEPSTPNG